MDNFYITLISNNTSSPTNQPASFRTYLPHTLQLNGQWECCLAELSFMKSWNNLDDLPDEKDTSTKQTTFQFGLDLDGKSSLMGNTYHFFEMSTGHYTQIDDLLKNFNENYAIWAENFRSELQRKKESYQKRIRIELNATSIEDSRRTKDDDESILLWEQRAEQIDNFMQTPFEAAVKMGYDNIKKRITLKVVPEVVPLLRFSSHLNYMMGFKDPEALGQYLWTSHKFDNGLKIAEYPINFNSGANSLYVYTDIIQPNIVSNKMARLLRIVNGSGEYGTYISKAYNKPYYMPVASNTLNSIEIEIKDEMGRNIKFSFGITIALLHFQRKRPSLF